MSLINNEGNMGKILFTPKVKYGYRCTNFSRNSQLLNSIK